jgi:lipid-A-disaccharide synthase-like uncharacterized protein
MRFVVQWYVSEKKGESIVPMSFWYIGIAGTLLIILYSYHVNDIRVQRVSRQRGLSR